MEENRANRTGEKLGKITRHVGVKRKMRITI